LGDAPEGDLGQNSQNPRARQRRPKWIWIVLWYIASNPGHEQHVEDLMETKQSDLEKLVAEIVSSYVGNNQVASADLPTVITTVYDSLKFLGKTPEPEPVRAPAVPIPSIGSPRFRSVSRLW